MSADDQRHEIARRKVVYQAPGADAVTVRRDLVYRETDEGLLTLDLYRPPDVPDGARLPVVVFVSGFSDLGAQAWLGCKFKEMESFISWARSTAASGLAAITYATAVAPRVTLRRRATVRRDRGLPYFRVYDS
jgi:hypothetical protein